MQVQPNLNHFSPYTYNNLPPVEKANDLLHKTANINQFVNEAKQLAKQHDVSEFFGVRLAHRHFEVKPNHSMADSFETVEDQPALVTRPVDQETQAFPSSWVIGESEHYEVFEYSTDQKVQECFEKIKNNQQLFASFHSLAVKYKVEELLCPAILSRSWEITYSQNTVTYFLEISYDSPTPHSVVKIESEQSYQMNGNTITTAWALGDQPIQVACKYICQGQGTGIDYRHAYTHSGY